MCEILANINIGSVIGIGHYNYDFQYQIIGKISYQCINNQKEHTLNMHHNYHLVKNISCKPERCYKHRVKAPVVHLWSCNN